MTATSARPEAAGRLTSTLRQALEDADNDYSALEARYRAAGLGELVTDPFESYQRPLENISLSASVLIGTHDSGWSLARTLISLEQSSFNRSHPDLLEVIVVDDGSTDGTWEQVQALELDLTVRALRQDRAGLTAAHNTALAHAQGDVIIFLDADVVLLPGSLEELMKRHAVLSGVTLAGFRFEIDPADDRLSANSIRQAVHDLTPAFFHDFRLNFPGLPASICTETTHLKSLGRRRRLHMANGAGYDLSAMVVGALFSIARADLLAMGGSDERLVGWGCEDSLIGARSIGLGNYVIPVYSAVGAHISHGRRGGGELAEFARNVQTVEGIFDAPLAPLSFDVARPLARVRAEWSHSNPAASASRDPPRRDVPASEEDRAHCLYAVGRFAEAAAAYERCVRARPDSPWPALGRAKSLRCAGEHAEARRLLHELARRHGDNVWIRFELGLTLASDGDFSPAHREIAAARRLSPETFEPTWVLSTGADEHKLRGNAHAAQGFHHAAVQDFELAMIVREQSPWAHYDRAHSLRALGRRDEALAGLRRADELLHPQDGNRTWVHASLAQAYLDAAMLGPAKVHLERARRGYAENPNLPALAQRLADAAALQTPLPDSVSVARLSDGIPGWLTWGEADLLAAAVSYGLTLPAGDEAAVVLELGSYCGRSTVAIAAAAARTRPGVPGVVVAIDPHEDYHFGGGIATEPVLRANLDRLGLSETVEVVRARSHEVRWERALALLFIDALHDYEEVRRDYELFRDWLLPEALVAFHDYDPRCPGVVRCLDELFDAGELDYVAQCDSLVVTRRARPSRSMTRES